MSVFFVLLRFALVFSRSQLVTPCVRYHKSRCFRNRNQLYVLTHRLEVRLETIFMDLRLEGSDLRFDMRLVNKNLNAFLLRSAQSN